MDMDAMGEKNWWHVGVQFNIEELTMKTEYYRQLTLRGMGSHGHV